MPKTELNRPAQVNRRRWLRQSVAATAVTVQAGFWTETQSAPSTSPLQRIRLAAIGVGNRGASNLASFSAEEIVALCDVDQELLAPMKARFPAARIFADLREALELNDLDAAVISTPDHTHFLAATLAMRRGLHVYCEKPLAHSVWEVRQLARTARQHQVVTQMGNHHHASDGYRRAAEIVQSGAIGDVAEVHAWTNRPIWPQGTPRPADAQPVPAYLDWDLWLGPAPHRAYHEIYHPRGWRGWRDFGCGTLGDMGPHLLDPVFWALKLVAPTHVSAAGTPCGPDTFPASSTVRFTFPERDSRPAVRLVWYDGQRQPPPDIAGTDRLPGNGVLFLGERARLFAPDYGGSPIVIPNRPGDSITLPKPYLPPSPGHHEEWVRACKANRPTSSDFDYGARLTETCLLGNIGLVCNGQLRWDYERGQFGGDDGVDHERANQRLRRTYRQGWEV